ncbi:MAG: thermostable hemolysin delta-VPH [Clostridia bacterium]|nr:thermostable hemolysin delta-VPH [Clostridia bacterium]
MMYYNYHAQVKKKLLNGELIGYEFVDEYNGISPALVLYFKNSRPMPIRNHRWEEYLPYIINFDEINNKK